MVYKQNATMKDVVKEFSEVDFDICPNVKEVSYTQLVDTHTVCYKCNMIHRKDEECKIDSFCNHEIELRSFDVHGDITHAYRCEKCFQRFVPIPSNMKLENLYYIKKEESMKEDKEDKKSKTTYEVE